MKENVKVEMSDGDKFLSELNGAVKPIIDSFFNGDFNIESFSFDSPRSEYICREINIKISESVLAQRRREENRRTFDLTKFNPFT